MIPTNNRDYKYLFLAFIGFLLGCFIFWNRLLRDRFARDIALYYKDNILFSILCLIIILFVCRAISSYINIRKVKNITLEQNSLFQSFILNLRDTRLFILWSSIIISKKIFYDFLTEHTDIEGFVAYFAEVIVYKVIVLFAGKSKAPFYIGFVLIPRIIVIIIFYIDIFVYNQLYYFYRSLLLLLIPIIFYSIIYMTKALCDKNIAFFMLHINYTPIDENNVRITFRDDQPKIEGALDVKNTSILPNVVDLLNVYGDIKNFFMRIEEKETKIKLYDQLFLSLAYLLGWLSVLYIAFSLY